MPIPLHGHMALLSQWHPSPLYRCAVGWGMTQPAVGWRLKKKKSVVLMFKWREAWKMTKLICSSNTRVLPVTSQSLIWQVQIYLKSVTKCKTPFWGLNPWMFSCVPVVRFPCTAYPRAKTESKRKFLQSEETTSCHQRWAQACLKTSPNLLELLYYIMKLLPRTANHKPSKQALLPGMYMLTVYMQLWAMSWHLMIGSPQWQLSQVWTRNRKLNMPPCP